MKKQNLFKIVIATITVLTISSCSTIRTTKTAKEISTDGMMYQNAVMTDLEVGQKVSHTVTFNYGLGTKNPRALRKVEKEIDIVTAELLAANKGDVLVERRYSAKVIMKPFKIISEITVEGYVGYYKDFRSITPKDSELIEINNNANGIYKPTSIEKVCVTTK